VFNVTVDMQVIAVYFQLLYIESVLNQEMFRKILIQRCSWNLLFYCLDGTIRVHWLKT
jgi:hypothetical protein